MNLSANTDYEQKSHQKLSFVTWTTLLGLNFLIIPWAYANSGLLMGILTTIGIGLLSNYTCSLILREEGDEYSSVVEAHLGSFAKFMT